ncbi:MAG: sarcosine oxidase subunit gamma [Methylophilales bacterium]|nr:sarcosine oxidase subunit gamma [Methylophilales bacterium]
MQMISKPTPIAYALKDISPKMGLLNGMDVVMSFGDDVTESKNRQLLGICDVSCLSRFAIKGPSAAQWLELNKIKIPPTANSWNQQKSGALVLRLGNSEFLIEDQPEGKLCAALNVADRKALTGLYKVERSDVALLLSGSQVLSLLSELCTLDLREKALGENALVMTQVAGISATIIRQSLNNEPVYRLWCDGTYGAFMWDTMLEIAVEHGGGAVGLSSHYKL